MNSNGNGSLPPWATDPKLSEGAKLTFTVLASYAWNGECFPGQHTIATAVKRSVAQVRRYVVELEKAGLIRRERRGWPAKTYYILDERTGPNERTGMSEQERPANPLSSTVSSSVRSWPMSEGSACSIRGVEDSKEEVGLSLEKVIQLLEERHDTSISGPGRQLLLASLIEDQAGVRACYEDAKARGDDPIALLLTMLRAGEHRGRVYAPTCSRCLEAKSDVRDRGLGPAVPALCDFCAALYHDLKEGTHA
jgi:hypothetical protein